MGYRYTSGLLVQLYLNGILPHTFFLTLFVTIYIKPMETINRVAEIANSRELRILHKRKKMFRMVNTF